MKSAIDRFNEKWIPEPNSGCWLWTGFCRENGYGTIWFHTPTLAHRFSYQHFIGPIPKGLTVDHLCRTRCCVNPSHLELVTRGENVLRGNGVCAINKRKKYCINGHPLSGDNLYEYWAGRGCKECRRENVRRHRRKSR